MNMAYAKDPVNRGMPYFCRASWLSTPPVNTSVMGYLLPSWERSWVDMNGCDLASQALL